MRLSLLAISTGCLLASGCAIAPGGVHDGSVTHTVVDYLHREWPLLGPNEVSPHGGWAAGSHHHGDPSACDSKGACPAASQQVYSDDWNQPGILPHAKAYDADPPPAVPLGPGGPGRFFPAPTRPAFEPRPGA